MDAINERRAVVGEMLHRRLCGEPPPNTWITSMHMWQIRDMKEKRNRLSQELKELDRAIDQKKGSMTMHHIFKSRPTRPRGLQNIGVC